MIFECAIAGRQPLRIIAHIYSLKQPIIVKFGKVFTLCDSIVNTASWEYITIIKIPGLKRICVKNRREMLDEMVNETIPKSSIILIRWTNQ